MCPPDPPATNRCSASSLGGIQLADPALGTPRRFAAAAAADPTARCGSYGYMAPEVLRGQVYDASCDIFSLGMCM